jgi:hypothetical protein
VVASFASRVLPYARRIARVGKIPVPGTPNATELRRTLESHEPGDVLSGTITFSGTSMRVFDEHGGVVLVDAGRTVVDAATDTIVSSHGPHHFDDYFVRGDTDALAAVCDALT